MKRIGVCIVMVLLGLPVLARGQASSYAVGGPTGQIQHSVYIQCGSGYCTYDTNNSPSGSAQASGPPFSLYPNIGNQYGSGSGTSSSNIGVATNSGVSFTASVDANASSVDPNSTYGGLLVTSTQGGTYYAFTLTQSSYVEMHATIAVLKGTLQSNLQRDGASGNLALATSSQAVISGFSLSASTNSNTGTTSLDAGPVLLGPGDYIVYGSIGAAADPGVSASASMSATVLIYPANADTPVGQVTCANVTVTLTAPGGTAVTASVGTPVFMGDIIEVGSNSNACVIFADNTSLHMGFGTKITINQYVYDPNATTSQGTGYGQGFFSAVHHLFVWTSGLIGHQSQHDVKINTTVGSIGIRGTEFILDGTSDSKEVLYLASGEVSIEPYQGTLAPPAFQPAVFDGPIVITFDQTSITTSPFDQSTYDNLKSQIEGATDTTPPAITCGSAPAGWQAMNVTIACTASDSGSGLANAADASFPLSTSVAGSTETANASTNSHQVCDKANNCATAGPITGIMIDLKPPSISISTPAGNTAYLLNSSLAANYQCSDGGSGVQSCTGPVANGAKFDTSSVGSHSFQVNATDKAGNASSASVSYSVSYNVCLLFDNTRSVQSGSTVPIRIALCDSNNNDVSSSAVVVQAVSLTQISTNASQVLESPGSANPDGNFRFDPTLATTGGYTFNLQTTGLTTGTYALGFVAGSDPTTHTLTFQVR